LLNRTTTVPKRRSENQDSRIITKYTSNINGILKKVTRSYFVTVDHETQNGFQADAVMIT